MNCPHKYWSDLARMALGSPHASCDTVSHSFPEKFQKFWMEASDFKEEDKQSHGAHSFGVLKIDTQLYAICFFLKAGSHTRITLIFNCLEDKVVTANMDNATISTEHKSVLFLSMAESFPVNAQSQHQKLTLLSAFEKRIEKASI